MSRDDQPQSDGSTGESHLTIILVAIGLPIVYVLGFGPAIRLCGGATPGLGTFLDVFYWPLGWLYQHTWLHGPLHAYLGLWVDLG